MLSQIIIAMACGFNKPINNPTRSFKYVGDIAPLGFFDPLKISNDDNIQFLRESELQHGRTAMVVSIILPAIEIMNKDTLGINYLKDIDFSQQLFFWYGMAILEFYRMYTGWNNPFIGRIYTIFSLKKDYQPGNLFKLDKDNFTDRKYNSELSNGRLAMLAVAHIIGSELVTGTNTF